MVFHICRSHVWTRASILVALLVAAPIASADEKVPSLPGARSVVPDNRAGDPRPFTLSDRYLYAAQRGDLAMLALCLEKGVDVHAEDSVGRSALLLAVRSPNSLEVVKYLHGRGLPVDEADAAGRTPLANSAGKGNAELAAWLVERGANVRRKDAQGRTPLFDAVMGGNQETVMLLVKAGAEVNTRDKYGDTPLISACNKGNDAIARFLVSKGANPSLRDQAGRSVRERAAATAAYCLGLSDGDPDGTAH